ncbi:hypothetical protein [Mycolicibacterium fortuitum]|uniref:hypothetical protein n=1 Tax=Mycolicibacterium fortuitum TaxID=1766 RepID=UPI0007E937D5|nr:hypothetical protein [Mycolicibacterium fortuitum]
MARDHTRINLDVWGDDEFLDLPVDAQSLYWTLWTSPDRTYCGAHWWHPGKLAQRASDWTVPRLEAAAAVLSERLFLVVDVDTEECLLRSWIKHDGLWRTPNMAVSMANDRAKLASRVLRGVVVHEVHKIREMEPASTSWERDQVRNLLGQRAVDPAELAPFTPAATRGVTPPSTTPVTQQVTPGVTPPLTLSDGVGVNPPPNTPSTTATATSTATPAKAGSTRARAQRGQPTFGEMLRGEPDPIPDAPPDDQGARPVAGTTAAELVRSTFPTNRYPAAVLTDLRIRVGALLHEGTDPELIRDALHLWDQRDGGPGLLPHLLADAVKARAPRPDAKKQNPGSRKVAAGLDLAARLAAGTNDDPPALEA